MAKPTTVCNAVLDALFNGGASGTVTLGALTLTLPYKIKFLSTLSTAGTAGTEWATSGGYTAGGVSLSGLFSTAAASASKSNTGVIQVTNAPAGTWAGNEIVDSTGTPNRLSFGPATSLNVTVTAGSTALIPIGSLTGQES